MAAISYSQANLIRKKERLLMINSYLGNICPFPLVTRNVKEELNMSTTPD